MIISVTLLAVAVLLVGLVWFFIWYSSSGWRLNICVPHCPLFYRPISYADKKEAEWSRGKQVTFMEPEPVPVSSLGGVGGWKVGPPARNMTETELRQAAMERDAYTRPMHLMRKGPKMGDGAY